jgi:two-component sensor histidine kinase
MLMDSQNRVRSMALIHQTLYQSKDFAKVDFGGFLEALVPTLVASYGIDSSIRLRIDVDQVFLPINAAIPCGLIVNELITNALKHAFPEGRSGEVVASINHQNTERVLLVVSDDGIGIRDDLDIEKSDTLGLSLVTLLSKQLNGKLSIQRKGPTRFSLDFPVNSI